LIKVKSLVPRIKGFEDDGLDNNDFDDRLKEDKKKMKKKKKMLEKKLVRELAEDTRQIEGARMNYQGKIDLVKEKKYKLLKTELERQQMYFFFLGQKLIL
jgi:hypothetical protein